LLAEALASRRSELHDVEIEVAATGLNPGWFDPGWEDSFRVVPQGSIDGGAARPGVTESRTDFNPRLFSLWGKALNENRHGARGTGVFFVVVSPPDEHGYCSFGADMWN